MQKRSAARAAWVMSAVLAVGVLAGVVMLTVWLRLYWITEHHGEGADLRGADLTGADVHGARYSTHTRWPEGFDPGRRGAVKQG